LTSEQAYNFDFTEMAFVPHSNGRFTAQHIKLLRLARVKNPAILRQVSGLEPVIDDCLWLAQAIAE
jgi:hypothetical protein